MSGAKIGGLPPRVWVCDECGDRRCILLRDDPPIDRLDTGCPWSSLYTRWREADHIDSKPADLLTIAASLSEASSQVMAEAAAALRGPGL